MAIVVDEVLILFSMHITYYSISTKCLSVDDADDDDCYCYGYC